MRRTGHQRAKKNKKKRHLPETGALDRSARDIVDPLICLRTVGFEQSRSGERPPRLRKDQYFPDTSPWGELVWLIFWIILGSPAKPFFGFLLFAGSFVGLIWFFVLSFLGLI